MQHKKDKILPKELTSYDLLKALAVVLMVIDHAGHHFFPDEAWLRIIGRFCVPIWFFLIGYSRTTELSKMLWGGAVLVMLSSVFSGQYIFPLNILFTIILVRFFRDRFAFAAFRSSESLRGVFFILFFLTFPSAVFFEYGAMGMMLALVGYAVRNLDDVTQRVKHAHIQIYCALTLFAFYIWQGVMMPHVSSMQALVFLGGVFVVGLILWRFKSVVYTDSERIMARSFIRLFQFMGRRTLEIYVVHILIFRCVCMYLYPESYGFMAFSIVPSGAISAFL